MKTLMLIEDDEDLIFIYNDMFREAGINVIIAQTGLIAIKNLKKQIPDLILLDNLLPGGLNGLDLLRIFKKDNRLKKIPVIVLSNLDTNIKEAKKLGCIDYLIKVDISLDDLLKKVKKHL